MTAIRKVVLKNELAEIVRLTAIIEAFCEDHQVPAPDAYKLNLALDEVVTNVIDYAYEDELAHEIEVNLNYGDGMIGAEVVDDGTPYDPLQRPEPDVSLGLEDRPIGGLGIYFVRQMMEKVEYQRLEGRNRLSFARRAGVGDPSKIGE